MSAHVILASNRLPVNVTEHSGTLAVNRSIGGVATALDAIFQKYQATWVGWMGLGRTLNTDELHRLQAELPERLVPVQAETSLVNAYYNHFSNQVLWPTMHHFWPTRAPSTADWDAMKEIARRFAAAISAVARPDDMIWVHDYHLMMVPRALREAGLQNKVGFFLHTPFATPQYWWVVMHHRELLESLCEVDLLGVQTQREVDELWECIRALGQRMQPGLVRSFPIGIDYDAHHILGATAEVQGLAQDIQRQYPGKKIIFSISRLDYTKGILVQLDAVELFLQDLLSAERQQYVYKMIVAPSREGVKAYRELQDAAAQKAADINERLGTPGWQPVEYICEYHGPAQMAAWFTAADVLMILPSLDGMNLIAKEYIAVRQTPGSLVMSTGPGAATQLTSALLVSPNDPPAAAEALAQAIGMSEPERAERWKQLRENVRTQNVFWWADTFIDTLSKQ